MYTVRKFVIVLKGGAQLEMRNDRVQIQADLLTLDVIQDDKIVMSIDTDDVKCIFVYKDREGGSIPLVELQGSWKRFGFQNLIDIAEER